MSPPGKRERPLAFGSQQGRPILTRAFAIVSAAMFDAYNSVERIGESFLVSVPLASKADGDAAVAQGRTTRSAHYFQLRSLRSIPRTAENAPQNSEWFFRNPRPRSRSAVARRF